MQSILRAMFFHLEDYSGRHIDDVGGLGLGTEGLVSLLLEPLCGRAAGMLEGWRDGMDVLLVFVSAIFKNFIVSLIYRLVFFQSCSPPSLKRRRAIQSAMVKHFCSSTSASTMVRPRINPTRFSGFERGDVGGSKTGGA